jgi:hypothetical protein
MLSLFGLEQMERYASKDIANPNTSSIAGKDDSLQRRFNLQR